MAISNDWTNKSLKIQQEIEKAEAFQAGVNSAMMISMADPLPPGGDTGRHRPNPNQKPSSPYEEGKSPHKLAGLQINPNSIMLPFVPKDPETDEDWGEGDVPGHPDWKMAHGEYFDDYGRITTQDPSKGLTPSGKPFDMPVDKEQQKKNKEMHIRKYHPDQAMNYPPPTERDKWLQLFQGPGGSLKHIKDPEMKKLILKRGAVRV